jgi:hypothetical protein
MANLLHLKASRTRVLNSLPTKNFGNDGDIVISRINGKGVYLCTKAGGVWYTANRLSELSRIDKTPLNILAKKLKIKDIQKSSDSDKFVVSEKSGELRYQGTEEVLDTLDLERLSVDYKTAYCSLGQYTNKEECEANGGTWYYSENESHDSISNTAENQLLTIGQSIGTLDSEGTLLYDGSTLEIKRNTDYDDNWQTSAQDTLLKLSYDSSNNTTIGVSSGGDLTITPSGGDTTLSSSTLTIGTIAEIGSDTDKILMSDSGVVKYVDGATLRGYIGAGTSSFGGALNDLSDVTYSSGDLTISSLDKIVSGALEFDCSGDMIIDVDTGCVDFKDGGVKIAEFANQANTGSFFLYSLVDNNDYFWINTGASGATTITTVDVDAAIAHLKLDIDGYIKLDPVTYTYSELPIGFTQDEPTFDATDTIVLFSTKGNKAKVTLTNNCTDIHFKFPAVSGNFICVLLQDGTGGRTISNWKTQDSAGNAGAGNSGEVLWAGGTEPTNTETADKADIASFYWDADNEIAYGTYTYNF